MRVADGKARFSFFLAGGLLTILAPLTIAIFGFSGLTFVISTILMVTGGAFAGEAIMKLWTQLQFPTLLRTTARHDPRGRTAIGRGVCRDHPSTGRNQPSVALRNPGRCLHTRSWDRGGRLPDA